MFNLLLFQLFQKKIVNKFLLISIAELESWSVKRNSFDELVFMVFT